jgi:hypothetical protein
MAENEREICGEIRHGGVDVACAKDAGHVKAGDYWHEAEATTSDRRVITSDCARHTLTVSSIERVEWIDPFRRLKTTLDRMKPEADDG